MSLFPLLNGALVSERASASVVLIIRCESGKQFFFLLEYEVCPSPPPQLPILLDLFTGRPM